MSELDAVVFGKVSKINRIITVKHQETLVSPNTPIAVSLPINPATSKMIIKTIYVEGVDGSAIDVKLLTGVGIEKFTLYTNSITSNVLYDIVDLPYVDEDGTNKIHLVLDNKGSVAGAYKIRISGIYAI